MATFDTPVRTGAGRVNLIPNPSFQRASDVTGNGWGSENACTSSINTTTQYRGSQALQLTATTTGFMSMLGYYPPNVGSAAGPIAITAGQVYTLSVNVRAGNAGGAARTAYCLIQWIGADRATVLTTALGTQTAITTSGWTQIFVTGTAPATAAFASIRFYAGAGTAGDIVIYDCMVLEPTATVLPYFDGSFDGARWSGAVNNSASYGATLDASGGLIQNVRTPLLATDAANKSYVDTAMAGGIAATGVSKRVNLIPNPSFETSITGWTKLTGPTTMANNNSVGYAGTRSLQLTSTTAGSSIGVYTTVSGLSPNTTYTFSFWAQTGNTPAAVTPAVTTLNSVGATVTALVSGTAVTVRQAYWSRISQTFTTGASATQATVQLSLTAAATTDNYQVDAFLLEAAGSASTYFDGSLFNARWIGTANASASELVALDANTAAIVNVAAPTLATDAATKSYVDTVALTTSSMLGPATKRTNLVLNPSFETGVTGWSLTTGTGAISRYTVATTGFQGTYVIGVYSTTASALTLSSPFLSIPAASVDYVASFSAAYLSAPVTVTPQMVFYDSGATILGTFNGTVLPATASSGTATRYSVGATAPAGAAYVQINIKWTTSVNNDPLYIDGILLEQQSAISPPGTYFDGTTAGYRWTGTAHASTSETALSAQNLAITNLATPVVGTDAANKAYVDSATPATFGKVILGTASAYKANLMPNPSFQDGTTTGWVATAGCALGAATTPSVDNSALLVGVTLSSCMVTSPTITNITAGANYVVSCQGRYINIARNALVNIAWIGSNGVQIGTTTGSGWTLTAAFTTTFTTGTAPAGARSAQVQIVINPSANGENFAFDRFQFETGTAPTSYADGESTNWHWTGARYTSWSETYYAGFNANPLTNVADPQSGSDAATKNYVDTIHQNHPRVSVTQTYNYNLFPSASITAGQSVWGALTASTAVGSTSAQVYSGSNAVQLTSSAAGDRTASSAAYLMPVTPNQQYSGSLWVRASSTGRTARLDVQWYNNAKVLLSTTTGPIGTVDTNTGWTQVNTYGVTAPANAWYAALTITFVNMAAVETHFFDYTVFVAGNNSQATTPLDPALSPAYRYQAGVLTGGVDTYALDANSNAIINVATPVAATDAATKGYVDSRADLYRQTQSLSSAAAQVDFYLPPGCRNATIRWAGKSTDATQAGGVVAANFRVNNSAAAVYTQQYSSIKADTSVVTYAQVLSGSLVWFAYVANAYFSASRMATGTIELLGLDFPTGDGMHFHYRSETFSATPAHYYNQGSGYAGLAAPYTQFSLLMGTGSWAVGSQFSLICE